MKFIIAPDKYKGSLSGLDFCEAVEKAITMVFPDASIIKKPMADGGDGTLEVVKHYLQADTIKVQVNDPLFRKIEAGYLLSHNKKTAFIEMSEASGYKLLDKPELNCMFTTSLGTGELISDALDKGVQEIILGIGGSATNDGGMGMAAALGYVFLDKKGIVLSPIGENLIKVDNILRNKLHPRLSAITIKVACDVSNPFYGATGAAFVYGAQKGASMEEIALLDLGLQNFADVMKEVFGTNISEIPGSGAAGGLGGGAIVFLNASLSSGINLIKEISNFDQAIQNADWIITGEGKLDSQTFSGKTISGVLASAKKQNIRTAAFCGAVELTLEAQKEIGLDYVCAILNDVSNLEEALLNSRQNLIFAVYNFANMLK